MAARLPAPSDEQRAVVSAVGEGGRSVVVDAVAGAGKSTTVLSLAVQHPGLRVLLLSYNRDLKLELRKKAEDLGAGNLEVHSYHSLAVKYYDGGAHRDEVLAKAVARDAPVRQSAKAFDVLVTDEAQDITPVFQRLVNKFLRDSGSLGCRLLVLGDARQAIYSFKGADSRFLTRAGCLRPGRAMIRLALTESFRLPEKCAAFVNAAVHGAEVIKSRKPGGRVVHYTGNVFRDTPEWCAEQILRMIDAEGYDPEDFFVLCPSVKSERSPYKRLENILSSSGVPCYVPISDESNLSDKVIRGKLTFTTYHQSKGRERRVVFVYDFDAGLYRYFRNESRDECPHALYVAITRPTECLYLLQSNREPPLPFLRRAVEDMRFQGLLSTHGRGSDAAGLAEPAPETERHRATTATDLVRFIKPDALAKLHDLCQELFVTEAPRQHDVSIEHETRTGDNRYEEVSDVNGLAIPSMWEKRRLGGTTVHSFLMRQDAAGDGFLARMLRGLPEECEQASDFLHVANAYLAYTNNVYFKMTQIPSYNWLDHAELDTCFGILDDNFAGREDLRFEVPVRRRYHSDWGPVVIRGRLDIVSGNEAHEIKCTESLSLESMLQTVVYKWMAGAQDGDREFFLLNIRTGERLRVKSEWYMIHAVMAALVRNKYAEDVVQDDEVFLRDNMWREGGK